MSCKFDIRSARDYLPVDKLRELQFDRFRDAIVRVYDKVEHYRKLMDKAGITPDDISSLEDINKLPFTTKKDLRDTYPFGMAAVSLEDMVRLHAAGAGKPQVTAYTVNDLDRGSEIMSRAFAGYGIDDSDIVQVSEEFAPFTSQLGATVLTMGGDNVKHQIMVMKNIGVTFVCCTPTYFCFLIEKAAEYGLALKGLPIRVGVLGSEPWSDETRKRIEEEAAIKAFDIYGLPEIIGPVIAAECGSQEGLHLFEDHFYPEIINPETGEVLPDGETGELVLTTLSKEAMPVIRYRTGDITAIIPGTCSCGRTIRKIKRIFSRCDDVCMVNGIAIFPSQLESAMLSVESIRPAYNIILTTQNGMDHVEIEVAITGEIFSDKVRAMEDLRQNLKAAIAQSLGIRSDIRLVTRLSEEGESGRIIDRRRK